MFYDFLAVDNTTIFNNLVCSKVGLVEKEDGKYAFRDVKNNKLMDFFYKSRPVMNSESLNISVMGGIPFDPLKNKNMMKIIFDFFIEFDNIDSLPLQDLNTGNYPAIYYDNIYVSSYGRSKSAIKNDKRTCLTVTMSDGSSFTTSPYFNDSLKYLEAIDVLIGSFNGFGYYDSLDIVIENEK